LHGFDHLTASLGVGSSATLESHVRYTGRNCDARAPPRPAESAVRLSVY
jgi:hypothetical protein